MIPDVPDDVLAAIDLKAKRAGLSRSDYLRRILARERGDLDSEVSVTDLERFVLTFADLDDASVMDGAWR